MNLITILVSLLLIVHGINCALEKKEITKESFLDLNQKIAKLTYDSKSGLCNFISFKEPFDLAITTEDRVLQSMFQKIPFITQTHHRDWKLFRTTKDTHYTDRFTLLFKQVYNGVPTFSGEIRVHLQWKQYKLYLLSTNLQIIPNIDQLDYQEVISSDMVKDVSLQFMKSSKGISELLSVTFVEKVIYTSKSQNYLCWWIEVESFDKNYIFHIFIDAHSGDIIEHYSVIQNALNREIWYSIINSSSPPYWKEGQPLPTASAEANNALAYTANMYNMMFNAFGIRSFNGNDSKMIILFDLFNTPGDRKCPNARWNTVYIEFCEGWVVVDILGHEWGHAYVQYFASLPYRFESGALNEGFADIMGESLQMYFANNYATRNDTCGSGKRWVLGEDISDGVSKVPFRDMYNPNCYGNPRSVLDINFVSCVPIQDDNGGVHTNSGILTQAYSISVDGITSSEYFGTISGIGLTKSFHIFLRALLLKLQNEATYQDAASALSQSCEELIGTNLKDPKTGNLSNLVISTSDCSTLQTIIDATQMAESFCTTLPTEPRYPVIEFIFPPIAIAGVEPTTTIYYAAQTTHTRDISETLCVFINESGVILEQTPASLIFSDYAILVGCKTPNRNTTDEKINVLLSWDGGKSADNTSILKYTYKEPITINQISPSSVKGDSKVVISITGSGFEEFSGCFGDIDVNGDSYDCLACVFGDIEISPPIAAKFIDSNHITCDIPPRNKLIDQSPDITVWVSKNNQIYFANTTTGISFISAPPPPPPPPPQNGKTSKTSDSSDTSNTSGSSRSSNSSSSNCNRLEVSCLVLVVIVLCFFF